MKITVLGCGSSSGVPLIGNVWGACDPKNPRNRRTRVSILVEQDDTVVLVDTSPDMREQLLACNLQKLDAVLYTHAHADHCHGIDELRSINWLTNKPTDIYADAHTMSKLKTRFDYVFKSVGKPGQFYRPSIAPHIIDGAFTVGAVHILPFQQQHGAEITMGFRFGDFAYSTDVGAFDEAGFAALAGIKTWVVDCVREEPHPTHAHLARTLEWIERVKPEQAFLTHMNHTMDYDSLVAKLPAHIRPCYDGMVIEC